MQWQLGILGTISAFAYRHREAKRNLCRGGRLHNLPNTDLVIHATDSGCYVPRIFHAIFIMSLIFNILFKHISYSVISFKLFTWGDIFQLETVLQILNVAGGVQFVQTTPLKFLQVIDIQFHVPSTGTSFGVNSSGVWFERKVKISLFLRTNITIKPVQSSVYYTCQYIYCEIPVLLTLCISRLPVILEIHSDQSPKT